MGKPWHRPDRLGYRFGMRLSNHEVNPLGERLRAAASVEPGTSTCYRRADASTNLAEQDASARGVAAQFDEAKLGRTG